MGLFKKLKVDPPSTSTQVGVEHAENNIKQSEGSGTEKIEAVGYNDNESLVQPDLEKRVVRKLDLHVLPIVMSLYLLAFLDRSNIGNAKIAGMTYDLHLVGDRYQWLLTIFYIAYILGEPGILGWKVFKPHYWGAGCVLVWGIAASCQAATQSWAGEMALRFIMGISEASYGPGVPYLLSFFYLRHELGFRSGVFLSAAPLATTFAGALAYGITSGNASIANWRLLFLVEGLPTICMSPIAFFFLPDSPDKAKFLNEEEKKVAKARAVRQVGKVERIGGIVWRDVLDTLLDAKAWFTSLMYFSCNVSFASLPVFLPTILEVGLGFGPINSQGLTAPPYFVSFLVTIATAWIADKTQQRAYMIMFLTAMGGTGYAILAGTESVGARYFAVFLVASGVFPAIANILPWVFNNQGTDTRRGVSGVMLNVVGQCGPILGTFLYPDTDAPRFLKGHATCCAFMFFTTLLAASLRLLLVWENRKLDKKYGTLQSQRERKAANADETTVEESGAGEENYGPAYRFVL